MAVGTTINGLTITPRSGWYPGMGYFEFISSPVIEAPQASQPLTVPSIAWVYQEFKLPQDLVRGVQSGETRTPELTGFEIKTSIDQNFVRQASFEWTIDYQIGSQWITAITDTQVGAHAAGSEVWLTITFHQPLPVTKVMLNAPFRLGIRSRDNTNPPLNGEIVRPYNDSWYTYSGGSLLTNLGAIAPLYLSPAHIYTFSYLSKPCFIVKDTLDAEARVWAQWGIPFIWTSPLLFPGHPPVYNDSGTTVNSDPGSPVSFAFRILANVADSGTDILDNDIRNIVNTHRATNLNTTLGDSVTNWTSAPCPSKFGVVNLWLDVRDVVGNPSIVDRILINPTTAGPWFSIYYSNDNVIPGVDQSTWDEQRLWTRVPGNYQLRNRETFVLPEPIKAKYIKLEFTHLQAQDYTPTDLALPVRYLKHPKWVADYFIAQSQTSLGVANVQGISYNALRLAYDYYLDDLDPSPADPQPVFSENQIKTFFSERSDLSDKITPEMATLIDTSLQPLIKADKSATLTYLIDQYTSASQGQISSTNEQVSGYTTQPIEVSSLNRDAVVFEKDYPVMYYYIPCRHIYRTVSATYSTNKAFFVGLKELALQREHYTIANDNDLYIETGGDSTNLDQSDLVSDGQALYVY